MAGSAVLIYGNVVRRKVARIVVTSNAILGVQQLRNEIQWGTFLGSTVFTGLTIIISIVADSQKFQCTLKVSPRIRCLYICAK